MGHKVLLVSAQHVTLFERGGKIQLKGMTKIGVGYLCTLMIHGARSVTTRDLKNRPKLAQRAQPIIDRQDFYKAVVALANKLNRISWVIVTTREFFICSRHLNLPTDSARPMRQ